jgi:hypothetical protein
MPAQLDLPEALAWGSSGFQKVEAEPRTKPNQHLLNLALEINK